MEQNQQRIIPIYASNGDAEAFLVFPHLFNKSGEWVGWVTPKREVYSVLGNYVGVLTDDPRITRKRSEDDHKPRLQPPPKPKKIVVSITIPLAPMMSDLSHSHVDVLMDDRERLHTLDGGELREDMD